MNKIKYIFIIFLSLKISSCDAFNVYQFFPELLDSYRAEAIICNLLKKKPINKNINFVCAPWFTLEKNTRLKIKPDIQDLAHLKLNNAFTICSFDNYERLLPFFKFIGIKVVFSASGNSKKYDGIDIVTIPYYARNSVKPKAKKDILYSFIGSIKSHHTRIQLFKMVHPKNTVMIKRDFFHYSANYADQNLIKKMEEEYADVLSRSRFSLCPRGVSAGTYRFWESLQAGAIPVLISDDYVLPEGFDWNSCIIRIRESDLKYIYSTLLRITPEQERVMRQNCLIAYHHYSGNRFDRIIRRYYRNK